MWLHPLASGTIKTCGSSGIVASAALASFNTTRHSCAAARLRAGPVQPGRVVRYAWVPISAFAAGDLEATCGLLSHSCGAAELPRRDADDALEMLGEVTLV